MVELERQKITAANIVLAKWRVKSELKKRQLRLIVLELKFYKINLFLILDKVNSIECYL